MSIRDHVLLLNGGVGGAKLALGLANILPDYALDIIINTGDDFEHLGLHVSPDIDTVTYTLSGLANIEQGWGINDDSLRAMELVGRLGGPTWFNLGDYDIGTNLLRTSLLGQGHTLTEITRQFADRLGIKQNLLPMSDDPVRTWLVTDRGDMPFQEYFVKERWQPRLTSIRFEGAMQAQPSEEVRAAFDQATLIIIGPSNPFLSIAPILAVPGIREAIMGRKVPCAAVSPLVAGQAIKGPTAKLMDELGLDVSVPGVVNYYSGLLDAIIIDTVDRKLCATIEETGVHAPQTGTIMRSLDDKIELGQFVLNWTEENLT